MLGADGRSGNPSSSVEAMDAPDGAAAWLLSRYWRFSWGVLIPAVPLLGWRGGRVDALGVADEGMGAGRDPRRAG